MRKIIVILIFVWVLLGVNANSINSFTINPGTIYTTNTLVTLDINATDANQMKFSCDKSTFSPYENYNSIKSWDLNSGNYGCLNSFGTRHVYLQIKYNDLNESSKDHNASIILDINAPMITTFSPNIEVPGGDGKNGQNISIFFEDNYSLEEASISLKRGSTQLYSNDTAKCFVSGTNTNCNFTDLKIDRGGTYTYTVKISDTAGNEFTNNYSFAFTDSNAPNFPTGEVATDSNININLNWSENTENDFEQYYLYRSTTSGFVADQTTKIGDTQNTNYYDSDLDENTTYYYKLRAVDFTGNISLESSEFFATTEYDLTIKPEIVSTTCDSNEWCFDNSPRFDFELDYARYTWSISTSETTSPLNPNYADCNIASYAQLNDLDNGTYYFKVRVCKPTGNILLDTYKFMVDATQPSIVSNLEADNNNLTVYLTWTGATDEGGSGLSHYNIYRSLSNDIYPSETNYIGRTEDLNTFFYDSTALAETKYYYKVFAEDNAGNLSPNTTTPEVEHITFQGTREDAPIVEFNIKDSSGEIIDYFNTPKTATIEISFSKEVNNFYLYITKDSLPRETLKNNLDNITEIDFPIELGEDNNEIKIEIWAKDGTYQIIRTKTIYFDNTPPTATWNLEDGQTVFQTHSVEIDINDNLGISKIQTYYGAVYLGDAIKRGNKYIFNFDTLVHTTPEIFSAKIYDLANNLYVLETNLNIDIVKNATSTSIVSQTKNLKELARNYFINYEIFEIDIPSDLLTIKNEADAFYLEGLELMKTNLVLAKNKFESANEKYLLITNNSEWTIIDEKIFSYDKQSLEKILLRLNLNEEQILETTQLISKNNPTRKIVVMKYNTGGIDKYFVKIIITINPVDSLFPNLKIVEAIPKQIIQSAKTIKANEPFEIIVDDPTIAFNFSTDETKTIIYSSGKEMTENQAKNAINWSTVYTAPPLIFLPETNVGGIGHKIDATELINTLIIIIALITIIGIIIYFNAMKMKKKLPTIKSSEELLKEGKTTMSVLEKKLDTQKTIMEEIMDDDLTNQPIKQKKSKNKNVEQIILSRDGTTAATIMSKRKPSFFEKIKNMIKPQEKPNYKKKY